METIPLATDLLNEEVASEDKDQKTKKISCWVQLCFQQREERTNFLKILTGKMHPQTKLIVFENIGISVVGTENQFYVRDS